MMVGQTLIHCTVSQRLHYTLAVDFYVLSILLTFILDRSYPNICTIACCPMSGDTANLASMTYSYHVGLHLFNRFTFHLGYILLCCIRVLHPLFIIRFTLSYVSYISVSAFIISDSSIVVNLHNWIGSVFLPFSMLRTFASS